MHIATHRRQMVTLLHLFTDFTNLPLSLSKIHKLAYVLLTDIIAVICSLDHKLINYATLHVIICHVCNKSFCSKQLFLSFTNSIHAKK